MDLKVRVLLLVISVCTTVVNSAPPATPFTTKASPPPPPPSMSRRVVAHAVGDDVTFSCKSNAPLPVIWRRKDQHQILAIGEKPFDETVDR